MRRCYCVAFLAALPGLAAQRIVVRELKHDVSAPLRSMAFASVDIVTPDEPDQLEAQHWSAPVVEQADPMVQEKAVGKLKTTPGMNLLGLGSGFTGPQGTFQIGGAPPDPNSSVGATQVVETVNLQMAVFDKATGSVTLGPTFLGSLFSGFNASCSTAADIADPVVIYDKQAGRWLINIHTLANPYVICFAVSTSSDATGAYNRYAFPVQALGSGTNEQLGVWPDAYYLAQWIFTSSSTYVGPQACAVDRQQMLAGQTATMQCFQIANTQLHGMAPSDLDGASPPPAGAPNYYVIQGPAGSNSLYLYSFHVDFATPASSTFTGPTIIDVAPYKPAPAFGVPAIPQPATTQLLDVNGNDVMPRLAYRNFPRATPAHESLLAIHSVTVGTGSSSRTAVRWYELRNPSTAVTVYQQGTFSPDTSHRWMGSIAMDKMGDIAIGYSVSSASISPGIRYTGRVPGDALNSLEAEVTVSNGSGSQLSGARWGDYTSMSLDPSDDCTMWYTGEYMAATGALDWATRLFSFRFTACQ